MKFFLSNKCKTAVKLQCAKIQLSQKHCWENVKIANHENPFRMLKIIVLIAGMLLGQTT